jgi:hypothetical protein
MSRSVRLTGPLALSRRTWLAGTAAWLGGSFSSQAEEPPVDRADDVDVIRVVEDRARAARLGPFRMVWSRDFVALGDAAESFLRLSLHDCELVTLDYLDHFRAKGFEVALPGRRLAIAGLADDRSYAAFLGKDLVVHHYLDWRVELS